MEGMGFFILVFGLIGVGLILLTPFFVCAMIYALSNAIRDRRRRRILHEHHWTAELR